MACHSSRTAGRCVQLIDASSQCQLIGTTWPSRSRPCSGVAYRSWREAQSPWEISSPRYAPPVSLPIRISRLAAGRTSSVVPYIAVATTHRTSSGCGM